LSGVLSGCIIRAITGSLTNLALTAAFRPILHIAKSICDLCGQITCISKKITRDAISRE
jgi:hypothetical protein